MQNKKNLFVHIEGQNDFYQPWGVLYTPGVEKLIKPTNEFIKKATNTGAINYNLRSGDWHEEYEYINCIYSDEGTKFPIHCKPGTRGFEHIIKFPRGKYSALWKKDNSIWHSSATINGKPAAPVIERRWSAKTWRIILGGVCSDICDAYAIDGFLQRYYEVIVLTDLVKGYNQEMPEYAAQHWAKQLETKQLKLMTSVQFLKEFGGR